MRRILVSSITALALFLSFSIQVVAETNAEDAYEYRESIMTALKGHVGAISKQVRGLAGEPAYAARHAKAIAGLVSELHTIFPKGSNVGDSEALPGIWEDPDGFAKALANAEKAAAALGEAADGGDLQAIGGAFMNMGKACKGCHEEFREEHEH